MSNRKPALATDSRLPDDFAARVVERVAQIKRRRALRRRVAAAAGTLSLAIGSVLFLQYHNSTPNQAPAMVAGQSAAEPELADTAMITDDTTYDQSPPSPAAGLFLPDAYQVTTFTDADSEAGWHSYDPWWNSNS